MNEKELKEQLLAAGATEEQIAKINFARIEEIISQAGNLDELCNLMVKNYPGFNVQEFKKAVTEGANAKDSEEAVDLSDEALENVAGGCFTSMLSCPAGGDHDWIRAGALEVKCVKCSKSIGFSELENLPSQIREAILEKFKK